MLNSTLSKSFFYYRNLFNKEIRDKDTNEKVFELAHFYKVTISMGRHLIQLVYSDKVGTIYCLEKIKLHSHGHIYGINIILQCSPATDICI